MRLAFFLLVFANLAFFVWSAGYLGEHRSGREPERLSQQLAPDSIKLLRDAVPAASAPVAKPAETPAPAAACRLVSGLTAENATALEAELTAAGLVTRAQQVPGAAGRHWVLIPSLPNRAAADKKLGELKALGVTDAKIQNDEVTGPFIVLLGSFADEPGAQEHLAALGKRGVRSARIDPRDRAPSTTVLEVRAPADKLERLTALAAAHGSASLADCPPAP